MKSSSYIAYYFFKFFALMLLFMGLAGIHGLVFPEHSVFDPPPIELSVAQVLFALAVFVLCFVLAKFMFFRIRVIRYDDNNIEIVNGDETRTVKWDDVRSVSKILTAVPPLYRMTFKDDSEPAYFVMSMFFYAYAIIWSWDFTGFYKFAQEKIAQSNDD